MSASVAFLKRVWIFAPFTLPLWLAPSLPNLHGQLLRTVTYLGAAFAIPVFLDLVGGRQAGDAFADEAAARPRFEYGFMPRLLALKFLFIQGLMLTYVRQRHSVGVDVVVLALLVGLYYGAIGIAVSHELMHRPGRSDRWLGDLLLILVTYPQFSIEHVYGHHIRVATPEDPATARLNEPLYGFIPRSVGGGLVSAWKIELRRLKARGQGWLSVENRMLWYAVFVALYYAGAYAFAGVYGVAAVAIQSAVAIFSLETINYMQHYGLSRKQTGRGRYERPDVQHCWNWETRFSGLYFLNLGRHSEHHRSAGRRFDALREIDGQPRLPAGLMPMYLTAMVPPLWFAIMNPRVAAVREGRPLADTRKPRVRRRLRVEAVFDRWGGYLMAAMILALALATSKLGFQTAILSFAAVALVLVVVRETLVLLPLPARAA